MYALVAPFLTSVRGAWRGGVQLACDRLRPISESARFKCREKHDNRSGSPFLSNKITTMRCTRAVLRANTSFHVYNVEIGRLLNPRNSAFTSPPRCTVVHLQPCKAVQPAAMAFPLHLLLPTWTDSL